LGEPAAGYLLFPNEIGLADQFAGSTNAEITSVECKRSRRAQQERVAFSECLASRPPWKRTASGVMRQPFCDKRPVDKDFAAVCANPIARNSGYDLYEGYIVRKIVPLGRKPPSRTWRKGDHCVAAL